jgi:protein SCO1
MKPVYIKFLVLSALLILPTIIFYLFVYTGVHHVSRLPFYGPIQVVEKVERGRTIVDTVFHQLPDFIVTTSEGIAFDGSTLEGKIHIANFLNYQLVKKIPVQLVFAASEVTSTFPEVTMLTFVQNLHEDTLPRPSTITQRLNGKDSIWLYMVGPDSTLQSLHSRAYFTNSEENQPGIDPYSLVLVDRERRIRGYYNPTVAKEVKHLLEDIDHLRKEYSLYYKTHRHFKFDQKLEQRR